MVLIQILLLKGAVELLLLKVLHSTEGKLLHFASEENESVTIKYDFYVLLPGICQICELRNIKILF